MENLREELDDFSQFSQAQGSTAGAHGSNSAYDSMTIGGSNNSTNSYKQK